MTDSKPNTPPNLWRRLREFASRNLFSICAVLSFLTTTAILNLNLEEGRNLVLIIAAVIGFPFLVWRSFIAQNQVKAAQDQVSVAKVGQDFDRYQKGADMLGHTRLSVRQAGLLALKELALRNPEAYFYLVQKVLSSFTRDQREEDSKAARASGSKTLPSIASDAQMALEVLIRDFFSLRKIKKAEELDLKNTNLQDVYLRDADLSDINLNDANLSKANLSDTNLTKAKLSNANLTKAKLSNANLSNANLSIANLSYTYLSHADLSRTNLVGADLNFAYLNSANLEHANLSGANLSSANLRGVKNLIQEQLDEAWAWADRPPELDEGLELKPDRLFDPALREDYEKSGRRGAPDQDF